MKNLAFGLTLMFLILVSVKVSSAQDSELFSGYRPNVAGGGRALVMPGYNFAGRGNRGMSLTPTNALDAIAYQHDYCERINYVRTGGKSASIACDQVFIDQTTNLINSTRPSKMRFHARSFRAFMKIRQSFLKN